MTRYTIDTFLLAQRIDITGVKDLQSPHPDFLFQTDRIPNVLPTTAFEPPFI
jgi:hypothetical protein